ncbi:MAG: ankyrin repeat domain-containing protein [Pseudomonadota bacterium]|nr:ankyrin repeat domain-containing protein [Pseudomonadota bacterium]
MSSENALGALFEILHAPGLCESACLEAIKQVMKSSEGNYLQLFTATDPYEVGAAAEGNTVLHLSAKRGFLSVIRYLVDEQTWPGVDINLKNSQNQTALHIAAQRGHFAIVQHLVKHHAVLTEINSFYDRNISKYLANNLLPGHAS